MNCSNCNTINEKDNLFCVSCGGHLAPPTAVRNNDLPATIVGGNPFQPTQFYSPNPSSQSADSPKSVPTAFGTSPQFQQSLPNFNPSISYPGMQPAKKNNAKFIWLGALVLLLLAGGGIGAFLVVKRQAENAEILPEHLGMFIQNRDKTGISEISKQDYTNAFTAKDELMKNDALPTVEGKPNLILYSDGKDIPLMDLKLIQLDTIKDDGTLKQINYQPSPVEGKPEMKRLRIPDGLANGKYAFALFGEFLDEGKHKLWAFQVRNAEKSDNGDLAKMMSLTMKPKPAPTPSPTGNAKQPNGAAPQITAPPVTPPPGVRVAYSKTNKLILRQSPSLDGTDTGVRIRQGQTIYILSNTGKYDSWKNMYGEWAYVQTEGGSRGYVFTPLLRY